jgi:peptidoglycan hydrolase-like protein with peptidoglycan-binding domain
LNGPIEIGTRENRGRIDEMKPLLKNLALAAAVLAVTVTLAGGASNSTALAQTTAPSAASSLSVKALQEELNKQGIAVKTDGVLGDDTRAAIRQYQSQHHLPVTGEPDKATLDKLGIAQQKSEIPNGQPPAGTVTSPAMGGQGMMGKGGTPGMMGGQDMMGKGGMPGKAGDRP